jgi:hypothetical protein
MDAKEETIFRILAIVLMLLVFGSATISLLMCAKPVEIWTSDPYTKRPLLG